jgi:hypothetical protein
MRPTLASHAASAPANMSEPRELLAAREHLARAEAGYGSAEGLSQLQAGLDLLDEIMAAGEPRHRSIAKNIATAYAAKVYRNITTLLAGDRAVPEPQLEHLFKVVLAFDQSDVDLPENARTIKIEIARRLIDRYYEGHSPEEKRKALEQLTRIAE